MCFALMRQNGPTRMFVFGVVHAYAGHSSEDSDPLLHVNSVKKKGDKETTDTTHTSNGTEAPLPRGGRCR